MLDKRYFDYFAPLIQEFVREIEHLPHPDIMDMPQPHFPLFGKSYEHSAMRLAIVGQDTAYWGDLRKFIAEEKAAPGHNLQDDLEEFRNHKFTGWGKQRQTFWGFAMMLLAALHGQQEWGLMKQGKMTEILDSFAWAEGNAVELYGSTPAELGVPCDYWQAVRRAGERLNRFRHLYETLRPQVVLIVYRGLEWASYFEGYEVNPVSRNGRLAHYHLPEIGVDVIHAPHPGSMNRIEGVQHFAEKIHEVLRQRRLTVPFPDFLAATEEGAEVVTYLRERLPDVGDGVDKYELVARIAEELMKRAAFMSVPALADLVNAKGGRTDYGDEFSGGRGTYRLVSSTYHRMMARERPDRARHIAVAFRRPDFAYAYPEE